MPTAIRRIRAADGPVLRALRLRALQNDPTAFGSSYAGEVDRLDEEWVERARRGAMGSEQCLFVAESDGGLVGLVGAYTPEREPWARHFITLWVAPEVRRTGVGGQLVAAVLTWCRQAGVEEITLWVNESNQAAISLYEQHGFVLTDIVQPLPSNDQITERLMILEPVG